MATLTRWDPFREMTTLRNVMDQMMNENAWPERFWSDGGNNNSYGLALDVAENEEEYTVKASIPGVNPDDLDISLNDNMLTIRGEIKDESEKEEQGQYHLRERRYGSFMRTVSLPTSIDTQQANADFDNGVLTLHLPKSAETKPRRINVGGRKTIEAEASGPKNGETNASQPSKTKQSNASEQSDASEQNNGGSRKKEKK